MGRKLLVICGPTATGKTSLALKLAKKFNGEVVSADSRQVYRRMDIGTGKNLPVSAKFKFQSAKLGGYYEIRGVKVWGYDLVGPTEEFSVAQYVKIANKIIKDIWKPRQKLLHSGGQEGKLPILVGGTGLYIKGVIDGIPTAKIPKNKSLRKSLEGKVASELFEILAQVDPVKSGSMNASDRKNPRRLVRAIEISGSGIKEQGLRNKIIQSILFIGLTAPKEFLNTKIEKRVESRVKQGIEEEIRSLFRKGVTWKHQSMQALGYRQWRNYFTKLGGKSGWERGITETLNDSESTERRNAINNWKHVEKQYVKRQLTWFKRDKRINWFDISKLGWEKDVERLVKKWYNEE